MPGRMAGISHRPAHGGEWPNMSRVRKAEK
nr:MAG TPA: hypothetical protein [Caudoviricetes sp.]